MAAIFLAAGATIGAVIGTMTNALKKLGTYLGYGLKTLGPKAANALPGLIGTIVSFLFKAAGSAIGFLAEHTWLLILAVVAFLFQKFMKKHKRDAINNRATMPTTPIITVVLLISCCGVETVSETVSLFVYHLAAVIVRPWRLCELGLKGGCWAGLF